MPATPIYYTVIKAVVGLGDGYPSIYRIATTHPWDCAAGIAEIVYLPEQARRYVYGGGATARRVTARHRKAVQRAMRRWVGRVKVPPRFAGTCWAVWTAAA